MSRVVRLGTYALAGLVAVGPPLAYAAVISVSGRSNGAYGDYWQGLMGNWFATVIGLVGGLPIALLLNRNAERSANAKRLAEEAYAHRTQLRRLYQVVERELADNLADLRSAAQGTTPRLHFPVGRWEAIVAGGEVRLIHDLGVLEALAQTYESIATVNSLTSMWLNTLSSGQRANDATTAIHRMLVDAATDASELVESCIEKVSAAVQAMDA